MSPMIANASAIRPPAPRPWIARNAIELPHLLRQPGEHRADDEHDDREDVDRATAVEVGDLAVQRGRRGRGQQVGGDDPGELVEAAELADDRRQGGRDDGLVERGEQHAEHQAADHHQDLPVGHVGRAGGGRRCSGGSHAVSPSSVGSAPARRTASRQGGCSVATSAARSSGGPVVQRLGEPSVASGPAPGRARRVPPG